MQFGDKDEHVYFWFPLLAGLSKLTFVPRPDIQHSALEVSNSTFESLKYELHILVFNSGIFVCDNRLYGPSLLLALDMFSHHIVLMSHIDLLGPSVWDSCAL